MASFYAFLDVKSEQYPLLAYELSIHQETDSLGRPASPTLGGTIDCVLSSPGSDQPFLHQWMFSPTMQEDGKIVLMQDSPRATLKTISFFNAYCIGLQTNFVPGAGGGGSLQLHVRLSPQRIAVGAIVHDNNWPLESHGAGETFAEQQVAPPSKGKTKEKDEPSAFSEGLHALLDVVGVIPGLGVVSALPSAMMEGSQGSDLSAENRNSRLGAYLGTAKFPYGTVGYGVHYGIGLVRLGSFLTTSNSGFGEAAIGELFNRPDVQALLAMENTPENNRKVAQLEYDYWTDVLTDSNQSLSNRIGGFAGVIFSPENRSKIQMVAAQVVHSPVYLSDAIIELKNVAQHRLEQLSREFTSF
ncbi:type VI secretion system tube protein TssD [Fibrella arboris]|uniref:type VI secretion system tube protein TssD n=1 Tax=Fibrella arboris TaxID=3242486 RepID=UPI0035209F22